MIDLLQLVLFLAVLIGGIYLVAPDDSKLKKFAVVIVGGVVAAWETLAPMVQGLF